MKKSLTALLMATTLFFSTPSFAWGDKEQGAVLGALGILTLQHLSQRRNHHDEYQSYRPEPEYYAPPYPPYRSAYIHRPMYRDVEVYDRSCNCYYIGQIRAN